MLQPTRSCRMVSRTCWRWPMVSSSSPSSAAGSGSTRYRHQLEGQLAEDAARLDAYLTGAADGRVVPLPTGAQSGAREAQTRLATQSG